MLLFMQQDENCENSKKATARGVLKFWGGCYIFATHHHCFLVWLRFIANVIPQTGSPVGVLTFKWAGCLWMAVAGPDDVAGLWNSCGYYFHTLTELSWNPHSKICHLFGCHFFECPGPFLGDKWLCYPVKGRQNHLH